MTRPTAIDIEITVDTLLALVEKLQLTPVVASGTPNTCNSGYSYLYGDGSAKQTFGRALLLTAISKSPYTMQRVVEALRRAITDPVNLYSHKL